MNQATLNSQPAAIPPVAEVLPAELNLADALRIMDVASELRRHKETAEREFQHTETRAMLREKLVRTAELTGESLLPEQIEAAIDWYYANLHEFQPPPPGIATTLANLYVQRAIIGKWALVVIGVALLSLWLATSVYSPVSPAGRQARQQAAAQQSAARAEQSAREQAEQIDALVRQVTQQAEAILGLAPADEVRREVAAWAAPLEVYRRGQDREQLEALQAKAAALHQLLAAEYTVFVVAGEKQLSAFERFFEDAEGKRISGHYVIVEARDAHGKVLSLPIRNDETNEAASVSRWAERVPQAVYERLKADKKLDGILNETRFAEKRVGDREERTLMKGEGDLPLERTARITQW